MQVCVSKTSRETGRAAAARGAESLRRAIARAGRANIILATGASQFDMIEALIAEPGIDWSKVTAFHLDEYLGLAMTHPASFRRYLRERFADRVPGLARFVFVEGDAPDIELELARLNREIAAHPIAVAFVGIGENGHLAFNDPPADFDIEVPYLVVDLDEKCRRQQLGEGWFASLDDVPSRAVSMSVRQILKSATIICTVPDARKAEAVRACVEGPISNLCPASVLRRHADACLYLDPDSASRLGDADMRTRGGTC